MRTNIVLDDDLVREAGSYSSATSKRALVHEALAAYVAAKRAERKRESYRTRLAAVRRRVGDLRTQESSMEIIHRDRERPT